MPRPNLEVGNTVEKVTGDYKARGVVRAIYQPDPDNRPDMWRVDVAITEIIEGVLLHVMSPAQVRKVD